MSPQVEFSRRLRPDALGEQEVVEELEATAAERSALARRFDLLALDRLVAEVRLRRLRDGLRIGVTGRLEAEVTQACVVTLAPVTSRIELDFSLLYSLAGDRAEAQDEVLVDPDDPDPPETVGPEGIDLGEAVAQQLALAIDPYPRAAGAELERSDWGAAAEEASPFKVLGSLKREP